MWREKAKRKIAAATIDILTQRGVVGLCGVSGLTMNVSDHQIHLSIHCVSVNTLCLLTRQFCWIGYGAVMPKLWNETIDAHRQAVREATLNSTADLVAERGLASVTMSKIAEVTGIGRATLYKYFPDVNAILNAWHERHVMGHLHQLSDVRDKAGDTAQKLAAVLEAYALMSHERHGSELATLLHRGEHVARAHHQLSVLIRDLLADGVKSRSIRDDIPTQELASFCLHALTAASNLSSKAAVHRLVAVTLAGLKPVI